MTSTFISAPSAGSFYSPNTFDGSLTSSRGVGQSDNFRQLTLQEKRGVYFGTAPRGRPLEEEDMHSAENRTRPYEWIGKNRRIEQLLIRKITSAEDFMIRFVLPIRELPEGGKLEITQIKFNDMSLDQIPEQGTGRLTTQTVRRWELSIERHGLAFMMEDGFAMTKMGIQQYNASVLQISNATVDMMVLDAYYNLLTSPAYSGNPYQQYGITHSNPTRDDLFSQEKDLWSILTKTPYGFWRMSTIGNNVFKARQVAADILIMPSGTREYLKRNRPETIQYSSMGERAVTAYLGKGYLQSIDGIDVYESSLYNVRESEVPEDPLSRIRSIGEFGDSLHFDNTRGMKAGQYVTEMRTRTIHDNASDSMKPITLMDMFTNSGLFTADGRQTIDFGKPFFAGHKTLGSYMRDKPAMRKAVTEQIDKFKEDTINGATFRRNWDGMCAASIATHNGTARPKANNTYSTVTGAGRGSAASATSSSANPFEMYSADRGTSGKSGGGTGVDKRWIYTMTEPAMLNIRTARNAAKETHSLDALSKSAKSLPGGGSVDDTTYDLAPVFAQLKRSSDRRFDATSIRTLLDVLRGERELQTNSRDYEKTPHMMYLRWHLRTQARQMELYDTPDVDMKTVVDLLQHVYGDTAKKDAVPINELMRAHMTGTSRIGQQIGNWKSSGDADNDDLVQAGSPEDSLVTNEERIQFRKAMTQIGSVYTSINAYVPSLLTGVYSIMVRETGSLAAAKKELDTFITLADWIVLILGQLPRTMKNTVSWKENVKNKNGVVDSTIMTDCAQAIVSALMELKSRDDVKYVAELFRDLPDHSLASIQYFASRLPGGSPETQSKPVGQTTTTDDLPITGHFFQFCIDENIPFPFDFLFTRPSMSYEVGSAIMLKKGLETGGSFYGEPDFQLSNEGARKVLFGFFTVYAGARVWKHQNVFVFPFIHCRRYLGGGNMEIFNNGDAVTRDRYLSGETDGKSIFILPIHNGERIAGASMDITGYFPDQMDSHGTDRFHAHYSSCESMKIAWGWTTVSRQYEPDHFSDTRQYNTVCFRMTQYMPRYDRGSIVDRGYGKSGQSHWGHCVYAGVRDDRCGRGPNGFVDKMSFQNESQGTKWM